MNKVARYRGKKVSNNITKQPGYIYTSNDGMVVVNELNQVKQFLDKEHMPEGVTYTAGDGIDLTNNIISVNNTIARTSALTLKADLVNGKVPETQLPSYVDDVVEGYIDIENNKFYKDSEKTIEIIPEKGKIYVDLNSNKTYRWGGTIFVQISKSLVIGETAGTAFEGNRGVSLEQNKQDKLIAGTNISIDSDSKINCTYTYDLPKASSSVLGGIKVGSRLSITDNGVLNVDPSSSPFGNSFVVNKTTKQFCDSIVSSNANIKGMTYLGALYSTDMPFSGNSEVIVRIIKPNVFVLQMFSTDIRCNHWYAMYCNGNMTTGDSDCPWQGIMSIPVTERSNEPNYEPKEIYHASSKKYVDEGIFHLDYTAIEVYPTSTQIPAGTLYSALPQELKKNVPSDYLSETIKQKIPAQSKHGMQFRSWVAPESNDLVIDWGDGTISKASDCEVSSPSKKGKASYEYTYKIIHDYKQKDKAYIIKIYGHDYWDFYGNGYYYQDIPQGIMSRCLDDDLPIASNVNSFVNTFCGSSRLFAIKLGRYSANFNKVRNVINFSEAFAYNPNILTIEGFENLNSKVLSTGDMFTGNSNMRYCDIKLQDSPIMSSMFSGCNKLSLDLVKLFNDIYFINRTIDMSGFMNNASSAIMQNITCSNYDTVGKYLWNNTFNTFKNTSNAFKCLPDSVRANIPTTWGGTKSI